MLTEIPEDPLILLSVVNTKLRDFYPTLDALCQDLDLSKEELEKTLQRIDYRYDEKSNRFI